jgi:hypothetical protein
LYYKILLIFALLSLTFAFDVDGKNFDIRDYDKLAHCFSSYALTDVFIDKLHFTNEQAILASFGLAWLHEYLGELAVPSNKFDWGDVLANMIGTAIRITIFF